MSESPHAPIAVIVRVGPGLGAALARRFASDYAVAVLARREEYLTSLVKEIESAGGRALAVPTNVAKEEEITAAFATIRPQLGTPEVLIYNAALRQVGRLMETTPKTFETTWRVSVLGTFVCA